MIMNKYMDFIERKSFWLFAVLPAALVFLYLLLLAAPQYEVTSQAIIKESGGDKGSSLSSLGLGLLDSANRVSREDGYILKEFLQSERFLTIADNTLDLRSHYSGPVSDFWNTIGSKESVGDFLDYFHGQMDITMAPDSAILTFKSRAFDPQMSLELNQLILQESERAINRLNEQMNQEQIRFAEEKLAEIQETLIQANVELKEFQIRNGMVDPESEAVSLFARISELESQLVQKKAEFKRVSQYMHEDAFQLEALRQEIQAIELQLNEEDTSLASAAGESDSSMVNVLHLYERLKMQREFALGAYTAAFATHEKLLIDATRQSKFLLVIAPPELPDESVYPKPLVGAVTTFVVGVLLFAIFRLSLATVRDHSI